LNSTEGALLCGVLALAGLYLAADLVQLSQGLDGTLYAGIANLMAAGQGSFWAPPHFESAPESFHDHPPLGLWLQSQWFALFGGAFWVEKAYSLLLGIVICLLTVGMWRVLTRQRTAWWPLLILLLMPVTTYAIKNNTLETGVTVLSMAAVLAAWHAQRRPWLNTMVGLLCFLAVFIKGPAALFVLGVPGCFAVLLQNNWRQALLASAISVATFAVLFGLMLSGEAARDAWLQYYQSQVWASLAGQRAIEHGRGDQLLQLGYNLLIAALVLLVAWGFRRGVAPSREFWAMLIIGFSAALPLLISPRQYQHYLLPSMPMFALAAGLLVPVRAPRAPAPLLWTCSIGMLLLAVLRGVWHFGGVGDHQQELADVQSVGKLLGRDASQTRAVVFCEEELRRRVYLFRHYGVRSDVRQPGTGPTAAAQLVICGAGRLGPDYRPILMLHEGLQVWQHRVTALPDSAAAR